MIVIPAIDLKDGKCVRLFQGRFDQVKVYSSDPVSIAKKWEDGGAEIIHVVDLDGALTGKLVNFDHIKAIAKNTDAKIELGGGLRDFESIEKVLGCGVDRVVLGTKAIEDFDFLTECIKLFPGKIVVGIDSKDGIVYGKGWTEKGNMSAIDLAKKVESIGVTHIICTDIARDGALTRPNFEFLKELQREVDIEIIASGGVSAIEDIRDLLLLNMNGVIVGKALYEENIDLREAISLCSQKE
ncbi:MAG: 1-(5-phosphoribosyl)-5-[(5-phosphoribosylamino)methylideneamino]imidazole-4-carboxamide isomerase [Candidatus Ancaeobacter aquaticus]|nr:1-(5-phosphoribosyl)-5-[(5-phosphoribosylamino)methylideneamino]imidazole-4-carboxamide isomerase [Candidatus Ancaeobacter aquaticus]